MKVHLIRIAMIVLAVVGALPATPVAARPKDPDSFQVTLLRQPDCHFGTNFVDPLDGLCPAGGTELATNQLISWRLTEDLTLLRTAADAVKRAGHSTLEMLMTTANASTGPWMIESASVGACVALDMKNSPAKLLAGNASGNALETLGLLQCR